MNTAFALINRGWYLHPCDHPDNPECIGSHKDKECSGQRGKHPCTRWSNASSNDAGDVATWSAGRTVNFGVDCGKSDLAVYDEDAEGEFERLCRDLGHDVPETYRVKTGKGWHYYFSQPAGDPLTNTNPFKKDGYNIDTRGAGGYVMAPGSKHESGAAYTAADTDADVLAVPPWLEQAHRGKPKNTAPADGIMAGDGSGLTADVPIGSQEEALRDRSWELAHNPMSRADAVWVLERFVEGFGNEPGRSPWEPATAAVAAYDRAADKVAADADSAAGDIFLSRSELNDLPGIEPLIDGVINKAGIVWMSGKFGTYKTFVALAWSCCVATGRAWEGHRVTASGPVVYVAAEGHRGLSGRLRAWEAEYNGGKEIAGLIVTRKGMNPRDPQQMHQLTRKVQETGAVLVVFDTLHRCTPGMRENDADAVGVAFAGIQKLKNDTDATVMVLHHTGYEGMHARGSSAQEDDADDAFVIKLGGNGEDRGPEISRTLCQRKTKEGATDQKWELEFVSEDPFNDGTKASGFVRVSAGTGFRAKHESNVDRIIREMDEAGVPDDSSIRGAKGFLAHHGVEIKHKTDDFSTAVAARKLRLYPSPGTTSPEERGTPGVPLVSPSQGDS